jgi:ubiquinone/menaquinone biosynthesis C-methylase UbiE
MIIETGIFYKLIIDPLLSAIRSGIASHIHARGSAIDIACGTGALAVRLSSMCSRVVGIDISESMIRTAQRTRQSHEIENLDFLVLDALDLRGIRDGEFDYATISMAMHQFPAAGRSVVLKEMKRVARTVIVADYAVPLPGGAVGLVIPMMERLAGREHYENFRSYQENGGIEPLIREQKAGACASSFIINGTFQITRCG